MDKAEILNRLDDLQRQIDQIRNYLLKNESESSERSRRKRKNITLHVHDYKTFFTWEQKIVFILKYRNRSLLSSEIVSFMDDFDTVFQYKHTGLEKQKILSTHLRRAVEKGVITRFKKPGTKGYYYNLLKEI